MLTTTRQRGPYQFKPSQSSFKTPYPHKLLLMVDKTMTMYQ